MTSGSQDTALLLLDWQEQLCRGELGQKSGLAARIAELGLLDRAGQLLAWARANGVLPVHVRVAFDKDYSDRLNRTSRFSSYVEAGYFRRGEQDAEICPEVAPAPGEPVISKRSIDPFVGTGLAPLLSGRGARRLYLAGIATHMVVESTARHAADMGFEVIVVEDACTAHDAAIHDFTVQQILPAFAQILKTSDVLAADAFSP